MTGRLELIRRLEEVGLATWPALETTRYDGWDLRAAAGVTKRSNSVSPLTAATLPLPDLIVWCERWYRTRGLAPAFRLTELADPALEPALAARGYELDPWVDVMTRPLAAAPPPSDVHLDRRPSDGWFARFVERRFAPQTPPSVVRAMLASRMAPTVFASIEERGAILATGIAAVHDGHVAVYTMHTVPERRREGLGSRLLAGLLAWGAGQGADVAFLQVHSETPGARRMYDGAGFEPVYRYRYRLGVGPGRP